jgi:hypothetical protein
LLFASSLLAIDKHRHRSLNTRAIIAPQYTITAAAAASAAAAATAVVTIRTSTAKQQKNKKHASTRYHTLKFDFLIKICIYIVQQQQQKCPQTQLSLNKYASKRKKKIQKSKIYQQIF